MTIRKKLTLLAVLALAVAATGAQPAAATSITSGGSAYSGDVTGSGTVHFQDAWFNWTCTVNVDGSITSNGSGQFDTMSLTGCNYLAGTTFTVNPAQAPWDFTVAHTSSDDGTLTITDPISIAINAPGSTYDCTYTTPSNEIWSLNGGTPAKLSWDNNTHKMVGNCGATRRLRWYVGAFPAPPTSVFTITTPSDLHVGA